MGPKRGAVATSWHEVCHVALYSFKQPENHTARITRSQERQEVSDPHHHSLTLGKKVEPWARQSLPLFTNVVPLKTTSMKPSPRISTRLSEARFPIASGSSGTIRRFKRSCGHFSRTCRSYGKSPAMSSRR